MSTINGEQKCTRCGGVAMYSCRPVTNEKHVLCYRCGFTEHRIINSEPNSVLMKRWTEPAHGVFYLVKTDGKVDGYVVRKPFTRLKRAFLTAMMKRRDVDKNNSYLTEWDDKTKKVCTLFGNLQPDYVDMECNGAISY